MDENCDNNKFCCHLCNYVSVLKCNLENHIERVHVDISNAPGNTILKEKQLFICENCNYKTTGEWKLKSHMNMHTKQNKYECNICNFVSLYKAALVRHMKNIHVEFPDQNKIFTCDFCTYRSNYKSNLDKHLKIHNKTIKTKCDFCDFATYDETYLVKHKTKIHTPNWDRNTKRVQIDPGNTISKEKQLFTCEICNYETTGEWKLKSHINMHTKKNKYECNICNFVSLYKAALVRHMKNIHTDSPNKNKNFTCDFCTYRSNYKSNLAKHLKIHNKKIKSMCDFCDFATYNESYLVKHITNTHTPNKNKKYVCEICKYATNGNGVFRRHTNLHTRKIEYKCTICEFVTLHRNCLVKHIDSIHLRNTHTKFKCDFCNWGSIYKGNLVRHVKAYHHHSQNKNEPVNFKCDLCTFVSLHRRSLHRHKIRKHNYSPKIIKTQDECNSTKFTKNKLHQQTKDEISTLNETGGIKNEIIICTKKNPNNSPAEWLPNVAFDAVQSNIKPDEEIVEIRPVELQYPVKDEIFEVIEKSL